MTQDIIPERPELPEDLAQTEAHMIMSNMGLITTKLQTIPDLMSGTMRVKRFGAWLAMNVIPHLHEQVAGTNTPLILPEPPPVLLVADTLADLGERIKFEVDIMIQTAEDVMSGKIALNDQGVPVEVGNQSDDNSTAEIATKAGELS